MHDKIWQNNYKTSQSTETNRQPPDVVSSTYKNHSIHVWNCLNEHRPLLSMPSPQTSGKSEWSTCVSYFYHLSLHPSTSNPLVHLSIYPSRHQPSTSTYSLSPFLPSFSSFYPSPSPNNQPSEPHYPTLSIAHVHTYSSAELSSVLAPLPLTIVPSLEYSGDIDVLSSARECRWTSEPVFSIYTTLELRARLLSRINYMTWRTWVMHFSRLHWFQVVW